MEEMITELMEETPVIDPFFIQADMELVITEVAGNFMLIFVVLLSVYPFLYLFQRLISFCQKAFDAEGLRKLEGGGLWSKLPDSSLYNGVEKIANVKFGEKWRVKK